QPPPAAVADPVDGKTECRGLRLDESFKSAAAEQAHQDAKRLEAEVRGLAVQDEKQGQRRHWRRKNNGRAVFSAHPPLIRPAATAQPATSFTTTLAPTSAAAASQEVERVETEREIVERMEVEQVDVEWEDAERPTPPRG